MLVRTLTVYIAFIAASACWSQPDSQTIERYTHLVESLSADIMDGRGPGHPGHDRARDFIAKQMQAIGGLEPAFVIGGQPSIYQPFEIDLSINPSGVALSYTSQSQKHSKKFALTIGREDDAMPMGLGSAGSFDTGAVFVGYGIVNPARDYDSYKDLNVKGKVVIAYRFEPLDAEGNSRWAKGQRFTESAHLINKARWAVERGAVAVFFVNPPDLKGGKYLRKPQTTAGDQQVSIPCFELRHSVFMNLLAEAKLNTKTTYTPPRLQASANRGDLKGFELGALKLQGGIKSMGNRRVQIDNIGFLLPGIGDLAHETVVLGAHYDHIGHGEFGSRTGEETIHPGADDNASGTAGVILAAEKLATQAQMQANNEAQDPNPRRTIAFLFFTAEERGMIGSQHMVKHAEELAWSIKKTTAMINLDMIGRLRQNQLTVFGLSSHPRWETPLRQAASAVSIRVVEDETDRHRSDHKSFLDIDIPAIHLFTGLHSDYHTPRDTSKKINAEGGTSIGLMTGQVVETLAQSSSPIR